MLQFECCNGFDLILFGFGLVTTVILLITVTKSDGIFVMFLKVQPALATGILVLPIPNYHNVLGFFKSMINYLLVKNILLKHMDVK